MLPLAAAATHKGDVTVWKISPNFNVDILGQRLCIKILESGLIPYWLSDCRREQMTKNSGYFHNKIKASPCAHMCTRWLRDSECTKIWIHTFDLPTTSLLYTHSVDMYDLSTVDNMVWLVCIILSSHYNIYVKINPTTTYMLHIKFHARDMIICSFSKVLR